jgi:hypothetical protein
MLVSYTPANSILTLSGLPMSALDLITNLSLSIVPNIENPKFECKNGSIVISSTRNTSNYLNASYIAIPVILTVGVMLAVLLWRRKLNLSSLPAEVRWSYQLFQQPWSNWSYRGTTQTGFYYTDLSTTSSEYAKVVGRLNLDMYQIDRLTLIYNRTLLSNFINSYALTQERLDSQAAIFGNKKWVRNDNDGRQQWVHSRFEALCASYSWNKDRTPILLAYHATSQVVAEKICETGFATLSSLDDGWYGKGIYFTSYANYCITYLVSKRDPCLLLSWVIPGNTYPVAANRDDPDNVFGQALKAGYQSHYVVTKSDGKCGTTGNLYDEIVIAQESHVVPWAIITVNANKVELESRIWHTS